MILYLHTNFALIRLFFVKQCPWFGATPVSSWSEGYSRN